MFWITGKKGFQIEFDSGYTVSVQFGPANYCEHYDREIGVDEEACGKEGSLTAEIAVVKSNGDLAHVAGWGDSVKGRVTPKEVLEVMNMAAAGDIKEEIPDWLKHE